MQTDCWKSLVPFQREELARRECAGGVHFCNLCKPANKFKKWQREVTSNFQMSGEVSLVGVVLIFLFFGVGFCIGLLAAGKC